jgi:hypothetical protein
MRLGIFLRKECFYLGVLRDLLIDVSAEAGIPVSDRNFARWYNMATSRLALEYKTAKFIGKLFVECTSVNDEYPISMSGCIGINRVLDKDGNNYTNYTVRDNSTILFNDVGEYEIHAQSMPNNISDLDTEMTVPDIYKNAIKYFIISSTLSAEYRKTKEKELKEDSVEAMAMFTLEAQAANNAIRGISNKYRQVAVGRFR